MLKQGICPYPPAIFDLVNLLKAANKSDLAHSSKSLTPSSYNTLHTSGTKNYVLDGGMVLQKPKWRKGITFEEICELYFKFIMSISQDATVVFDGYLGNSTKDVTHRRQWRHQFSDILPSLEKKSFC